MKIRTKGEKNVRTKPIFFGGLITGIILLVVGDNIYLKFHNTKALDEHQTELAHDIKDQSIESNDELVTKKIEHELWVVIGGIGLWSVDAGFLDIAEQFANKCLQIADKYKDDWNYGNAICKGHLTLGRIELLRGNISDAKSHLILAGKTPGSPQLDTYGPNMLLAKELLEKGEKETVLEFLKLCERFWGSGLKKLKKLEKEIKSGEIPSFRDNFHY